ncbi:hypothetical protein DS745_16680 [Anaerobacillus alkaliphilus]|uniref:Uncharacterized protein n=1 Tax=Anaerobacillus alkaliphilus TaxID=1548597 RepID=A0A4Q0VPX8_9BACI|nr:hypothetical protein [Anaerobacillus alkaliphilus]RXI97985.1 hypothetical protein DS745_16680 [Anaerobacillus alkaliphilus]
MFFGSWKINIVISIFAFLLVFIGSYSTNTVVTSIFRACFAFLFFYLVTYLLRWLLMVATKEVETEMVDISQIEENKQEEATRKLQYSKDDIEQASKYVKDLIND